MPVMPDATRPAAPPPHNNLLGESLPPAQRPCFGRDEFIERVVGLAETLEPIALIGAGGTGKTYIALAVLRHKRINERFGENRRFIRCDQFPVSRAHFLARLSEVIGAGVKNPTSLTSLRPFLSSKKILIILDNAESILDPQGTNAKEIYSVVDELCRFKTICLLITSRISTVPQLCKRPEIPTLSMEAACDIFYDTYGNDGRYNVINNLLLRLDFHPLSIILLATTASHHAWDHNRLVKEWETQRAQVLQIDYNESLAATIELSLGSPTFRSLGPNARDLLGVVAFFPQGIHEVKIDWLFPTISNIKDVFDKFHDLSLTHRNNGFVTMLAPVRDYLSPQDPRSSPLLCTTKDRYFDTLSVNIVPGSPVFEESQWIVWEDLNVEHLLDVFTSIDPDRGDVWKACCNFIMHLSWHKPRQNVLGLKIEALPDDHRYKLIGLVELSRLFARIGNLLEQKALLTYALELGRQRRNGLWVAGTLVDMATTNLHLRSHKEGIQQLKEALEFYERIGDEGQQVDCWIGLAHLLLYDGNPDTAEEAIFRAVDLVEDSEFPLICRIYEALGEIYQLKGEKRKAIHHFKTAFGTACYFDLFDTLFELHLKLAHSFVLGGEFDEANIHIEHAKSRAVNDPHSMGRAMAVQADIWCFQGRLEDAKLEVLCAFEIFEKLGAAEAMEMYKVLLQHIERAMESRSTSFKW